MSKLFTVCILGSLFAFYVDSAEKPKGGGEENFAMPPLARQGSGYIQSTVIKAKFDNTSAAKIFELARLTQGFFEGFIGVNSRLKVRQASNPHSPTLLFVGAAVSEKEAKSIIDGYFDEIDKTEEESSREWLFKDDWQLALFGRDHKVVTLAYPGHPIEQVHKAMDFKGRELDLIPADYKRPHSFAFHISLVEFYQEGGLDQHRKKKLEDLFMGSKPEWAGEGPAMLVEETKVILFKEMLSEYSESKLDFERYPLKVDGFSSWSSSRALTRVRSTEDPENDESS